MFQQELRFDGADFDQKRDGARLTKQLLKIVEFMKDGKFYSLREISNATGIGEASVSAQLRNLRKNRFGAHTINRQHILNGLNQYQLVINTEPPPPSLFDDKENN